MSVQASVLDGYSPICVPSRQPADDVFREGTDAHHAVPR